MPRPIPVVVFFALGVSAASAAGLSTKSFGEGGGYKHPDAAVGGFLETPDRAISRGSAASTRRQRPRPFAPAITRESVTDDAASEDARRDYGERLLGTPSQAARRGQLAPGPGGNAFPDAAAHAARFAGEGSLFVTFELDEREAGSLRDAVAGLGAAVAFRPDARFEPLPGAGGSVRVSGWLPVSRLGEAIARPGVKRIDVARGSQGRALVDSGLVSDFLISLRVADAAHPEESIAAGIADLAKTAGFKVRRVFGVDSSSPHSSVAVVAGSLPLNRLARAMERPGVVAVRATEPYGEAALPTDFGSGIPSPMARSETPPSALRWSRPAAPASKTGGFLRFAMTRGAWLVLLTLLLLLPAFATALKNGLAVFVPYR